MTRERYEQIQGMTADERSKLAMPEQDEFAGIIAYREGFSERVYNYAMTLLSQRNAKEFEDMLSLYDKHSATLKDYAICVTEATDLARRMDKVMSPERGWTQPTAPAREIADDDEAVQTALTVERFRSTVLLPGSALDMAIQAAKQAAAYKMDKDTDSASEYAEKAVEAYNQASEEDSALASMSLPWTGGKTAKEAVDILVGAFTTALAKHVMEL